MGHRKASHKMSKLVMTFSTPLGPRLGNDPAVLPAISEQLHQVHGIDSCLAERGNIIIEFDDTQISGLELAGMVRSAFTTAASERLEQSVADGDDALPTLKISHLVPNPTDGPMRISVIFGTNLLRPLLDENVGGFSKQDLVRATLPLAREISDIDGVLDYVVTLGYATLLVDPDIGRDPEQFIAHLKAIFERYVGVEVLPGESGEMREFFPYVTADRPLRLTYMVQSEQHQHSMPPAIMGLLGLPGGTGSPDVPDYPDGF